MTAVLRSIGPARVFGALLALATLPCLWLQDVRAMPWRVLFGAVAPGVAFFLVWAIPFDMLMARVFMSDTTGAARVRYRTVIRVDLLIWLLLLAGWGWFFLRLVLDR